MNRKLKIIIPIVCVAVVGITFYFIFDIKNKVEDINYGTNNIEVDNEVENEIMEEIDTLEENVVEDYNKTDTSKTNTTEATTSVNTTSVGEEISEEDDAYSNNKLEEAKSLVQKAWGEDDSVYFTTEGVNSEGLYMVAAREKSSTNVRNYFKVNLETKKVEVDY